MMEYKFLKYSKESSFVAPEKENIGVIALNRPKTLNALNKGILEELSDLLDKIEKDDEIRAVVIKGEGRAFSAGADLSQPPGEEEDMRANIQLGQSVFDKIEDLNKPVVAAIKGYAIAGGLELALACDIRVASEDAQVGFVETNVGLIPSWGGVLRLPKLIGRSKATELILTAQRIDAKEAEKIGILNKVVPTDELESTAMWTAGTLATKAPIAVNLAKEIVVRAMEIDRKEANKMMEDAGVTCLKSEDIIEGVSAMFEKRTPEFKGK